MQVRSGDICILQNPKIWNQKLGPEEIIPVNDFNVKTTTLTAWEKHWNGKPVEYHDGLRKFLNDWRNGMITDTGKWNSGRNQDKLWTYDIKYVVNGRELSETMTFDPMYWFVWPETTDWHYRLFSGVSNFDGNSPGNQFHLAISDKDGDVRRAKLNTLHDFPKSHIISGETDVYNPITQMMMHDWEFDSFASKKCESKKIRRHGCVTMYWIKNKKHGFVYNEWLCEDDFHLRFRKDCDPTFMYGTRMGYIREYRGGFAWNYVEDFVRNVLNGCPDQNVPSIQIEKYMRKESTQIKINFHLE